MVVFVMNNCVIFSKIFFFLHVLYMEKGSRSYQRSLCMEQADAIVQHEQKFPLCTEILVVLNLGVWASL